MLPLSSPSSALLGATPAKTNDFVSFSFLFAFVFVFVPLRFISFRFDSSFCRPEAFFFGLGGMD